MEISAPPLIRAQLLAPAMVSLLSIVGLSLLAEILTAALPLRAGDAAWRFQAEGLVLNAAPQWAVILVLVLAIGLYADRIGVVKAGAIVCLGLAVTVAVLLPFFALDFLTVRQLQTQSRRPAFQRVGIKVAALACRKRR